MRTLAKLHAHGDIHDPYVLAEYNLIMTQISQEHSQKKIGYLDLFRGWPNLRRTILVMAVQASCQMTGVSAIQYFSPQIFAQIGISTGMALLFQAVNAIIAFLGTTVCILTIDKIGRRPLEIHGCLFLCVTFIINAAIIKVFPTDSSNTGAHWAFVVLTWLFNFAFFWTSGPLSWAIPAELFGTGMRLKGVSWGAMTSFAFNTMIGQVTPIAVSAIGWKYYIVFIVCNLTNALFFWAFQPETKGLNLEDMVIWDPSVINLRSLLTNKCCDRMSCFVSTQHSCQEANGSQVLMSMRMPKRLPKRRGETALLSSHQSLPPHNMSRLWQTLDLLKLLTERVRQIEKPSNILYA